ncbi:hypothetical protein [Haladaptatus sp. CMAA 1911]
METRSPRNGVRSSIPAGTDASELAGSHGRTRYRTDERDTGIFY